MTDDGGGYLSIDWARSVPRSAAFPDGRISGAAQVPFLYDRAHIDGLNQAVTAQRVIDAHSHGNKVCSCGKEIRPLILPEEEMLRRAHQCHKIGCDHMSRWQLGLELKCGKSEPLKCVSSIKVCDKHVLHGESYLLSDHNKTVITEKLLSEGFDAPEFVRPVVLPIRDARII
jgi:hypothetical protein